MSSAYPELNLEELINKTVEIGAQGIEALVFRNDGAREDHTATHIDYVNFGVEQAKRTIEQFNQAGLKFSIGAYENIIGGDGEHKLKNQNHLLALIRMAALMGGDSNNIMVGTFVGYNHGIGSTDHGFQKNLNEYQRVFAPIIKYAEDLGVTVIYENCPMEGWMPASYPTTYNNLSGTLAARKLMYALIPSLAHGETYDPSHDIWQHIDPVEVIKASDIHRIKRIHIKTSKLLSTSAKTHWGATYPMQAVDPALAEKAGIPYCTNSWDRHHYEAMLPGFGGTDSMDWNAFMSVLKERGYKGPFPIENEANNSKGTGNQAATTQGFKAVSQFLAPLIWPLGQNGYEYHSEENTPLKEALSKNLPLVTMKDL